ncbi:MAG: MASE1 domain-containing protein, partial [Gemmatimonadota bacterium]|nr:MASE1 domain-containing protein [Gemmatimonadota bacterium]
MLAGLYVVAARIGLALDAVAGFATLVWPPTGIALAAVLLRGHRVWPAVMIGAAVANVLNGAPTLVATGIALGNTAEALVAAYALRRVPGFRTALDRLASVLALIVLAATLSTMIAATIGVSSLYFGDIVALREAGMAWRAWWLGDFFGALLVAPAILVWGTARQRRPPPYRLFEASALALVLVAVSVLIFGTSAAPQADTLQQAYLIFPPLIWAALRFEQRGAASAAFVVSLVAIWATATGHGPFVREELYQGLLALQTFLGVTAATFLLLGASIAERRVALQDVHIAISEQQRLHAERDIAHQRLVTVLEQSPVAISIADAPSGRFLFVNDEATRLLGERPRMSKAADPAASAWRGLHPDGRPFAPHEWPVVRALRQGETVRNVPIRVVRGDGSFVDIAVNSAPVRDTDGSIIAAVLIFWDVTAMRRAEEELRVAHETIAAANRAKAEFFGVMSHELRTPLNAIAGYVELMALGIHGPLTEEQSASLDRIQRNQQHLLSLIDDVLTFAKIEADQLSLELKRVNVRGALEQIEPVVAPDLERKTLTLACNASDSSLAVRADPAKLRQVLLNLVGNAIKFTPSGGRVVLSAARHGDLVHISVSDTGIGIPSDQVGRVFEPFFQAERGPTRRFPGVGLGLAIARDLAR